MFNIGFIGLGVMGYWMASHLTKKYKKILVFNRSKKNVLKLKKKNSQCSIVSTDSLKEVAEKCNIIISCVGNDKDLQDVYLSKNGIFNFILNNTVIIDHTTSSSNFAEKAFKQFKLKKSFFFDAPVSGGEIGAKNGALSIMIGGSKSRLNKILPLLKCYSKIITYTGKSGTGQLTKMVNQICVAGVIQSLSEALIFAKRNNLSFDRIFPAITSGAAQSWQMENRSSTMWNGKFNFGFMNKHMYKDLRIIENVASKHNINLPITRDIVKFYKQLIEEGYEKYDTSSLIKLLN